MRRGQVRYSPEADIERQAFDVRQVPQADFNWCLGHTLVDDPEQAGDIAKLLRLHAHL
jgi:hypothetical protein